MRRWGIVVLALAALLLGGCTGGDGEAFPITHWTLTSAAGVSEVTVPAHLNDLLPSGPTHYTLRTRVPLPAALRDQPLTLAVVHLPALVELRAGGREAAALDASVLDRYRSQGPHRWRIASAETHGPDLDLELDIDHRWVQSAWIGAAPTLSATLQGDRRFLFVSNFNQWTAIGALATTLLVSFTYGVLYALDRRRRVHAWHAAQGIFGSFYPALIIGLLQPVFGTFDVPAAAIAITIASVCSVYFVAGIFELPTPSPAWWLFVAAAVLASVVAGDPFHAVTLLVPLVVIPILATSVNGIVTLVRAWRVGKSSLPAALAALGFPLTAVLGSPDIRALLGLGSAASGLRGGALAIGTVSLLQAVALSRNHIDSLHRADDLNAQLAGRVSLLESNNQQIRVLNEELRRQVSARSQRLVEALSRLGPFPSRARELTSGEVVDERYRVVRRIGEGGMGTVYEVERVVDSRRLALKVLQGHRSGSDLARLAREAEIASRIDHPNVVGMVDVDISASGAVFLVMEYVDGSPLDELSARFGDAPWALDLLRQIADGLAVMHALDIVHRDLKPGNVLVARDAAGKDVAKIADFGIAMHFGGSDETTAPIDDVSADRDVTDSGRETTDPSLTRTGQVLGTPLYMAPELARGAKHASAASDVFALGIIAFELITGELPSGYEALAHLRDRTTQRPSFARRVPFLSAQLAALLDRCLARDPAVRPTARELAEELGAAGGRIEPARGIPAA